MKKFKEGIKLMMAWFIAVIQLFKIILENNYVNNNNFINYAKGLGEAFYYFSLFYLIYVCIDAIVSNIYGLITGEIDRWASWTDVLSILISLIITVVIDLIIRANFNIIF